MVVDILARFVIISLIIVFPLGASSQDYGLLFAGHEVVVEKRTALDLAHERYCFKGKVELSFDLKFQRNAKTYYGYIFRIVNSENLNLDFIYNPASQGSDFNLVIGEKLSKLKFNIRRAALYEWRTIRVIIDLVEDEIQIIAPDTTVSQKNVGLKRNDCFEIVFGRSQRKGFVTNDLPPMSLRDIRILDNDRLKHHWPLDEVKGNIAHDIEGGSDVPVANPEWISQRHYNWKKQEDLTFSGPVTFTFDAKEESVVILSNDSLTTVPVSGHGIKFMRLDDDGGDLVHEGDQAIFFDSARQLINVNLDKKVVSVYDFDDHSWDKRYTHKILLTKFWHHNKTLNPLDSSIIMIGGYGRLKYKNLVQRFDLNTRRWDSLKLDGDYLEPRYLFGLGSSGNKEISYLIGGYGSSKGAQMLNPRNYYDLFRIDWKNLRIEKVYEFSPGAEPFAFASSIVIDDADSTYYGLIFPQLKYDSYLRLTRGSLTQPVYELYADSIPYHFYDVGSFADLYFARNNKLLVAVTSYFNKEANKSVVKIYTLRFPPSKLLAVAGTRSMKEYASYLLYGALAASVIGILVIFFRRRYRDRGSYGVSGEIRDGDSEVSPHSSSEAESEFVRNGQVSRILFFGGFRVFDKKGEEITNKFTPLLRELFLLIVLNSIRFDKGISSHALDQILWFDKSEKSARNNRSVNIAKLKSILDEIGDFDLSKGTGYWKINFDDKKIHIDYHEYLKRVRKKGKMNKVQVCELASIIGNGTFLHNLDHEWLDDFKSSVSHEIVDSLLEYCKSVEAGNDFEHMIQVSNLISMFDPLNEEAMHLNCRALSHLGKHALAKNAFEKFSREYHLLYDVPYEKTFQKITE